MGLNDSPPVKFLSARNEAILGGPLLIRHNDAMEHFHTRQTTLLPLREQLLQHQRRQLLVMHQLLEVVSSDSVGLGKVLEVALVGHDDGHRLVLLLVGVDEDVLDDGGGAVDRFELITSARFYTPGRGEGGEPSRAQCTRRSAS
jgi:hypothetical protein